MHLLGSIVGFGGGAVVFVGAGVCVAVLVGCGVSVGLRSVGVCVADGPGVSVPVGVELRTSVGVSVFEGELVEVGFERGVLVGAA